MVRHEAHLKRKRFVHFKLMRPHLIKPLVGDCGPFSCWPARPPLSLVSTSLNEEVRHPQQL